MEYVYLLMLVGLVIALCIFINRITDKLKVPSLLLFIGLGMIFGVVFRIAGLGNFTDYNLGNVVCSVCLVFVIFYGGFGTNFKEARPVAGRALLLSFAGTALTAGIVGVFVYFLTDLLPFFPSLGWAESMLIGSVISSTDAASVFNILRSRRLNLKYGTSSLLEMESGSNDPMSYMLTVVFTAVIAAQNGIAGASQMGAGEIIGMLFSQVGFGALFGAAFGFLSIFILKKFSFNMGQGGTIFILAIALITYALPTMLGEVTDISILAGNGYLAVYICGIMIGNARIPQKRDCVRFFDALTSVAQMMIFFLLGLLATPEDLVKIDVLVPALLIFLFMTVIARPVAVTALLAPFRVKPNQIGVISWAGLRGVASIVFAVYAMSSLGVAEPGDALPYDLFSIVFVIVIVSIALQGSLLPLMSKKLHMLGDNDNVLRTFTDYQEESDVCFVKVRVGANHPWYGKKLREVVMPREFLAVLIIRGEDTIVPGGDTVILDGDVIVTAAPEFENRDEFGMYEEYIGKEHPWAGKTVRELSLPRGTLIVMIKRKKETVVPNGAAQILEGDVLAMIKLKEKEEPESLPEKA